MMNLSPPSLPPEPERRRPRRLWTPAANGAGGVIRVNGGGNLTTSNFWSSVGYNRTAQMIVETGGSVNCGDHLWIWLSSPAVGTLDVKGGTVNVVGQFGLGGSGGTGFLNLRSNGIINLSQFSAAQSISGASVTFTFPLTPGTNTMFYRTVSP
jgi:hypothetical protein